MRYRILVPALGIVLWLGFSSAGEIRAQYDDPPFGGDPDTPAGCAGVQAKVTLEHGTLSFNPAHIVVTPGTPVCWTWSGMSHSVRADDGSFGSGPPISSASFQRTFNTPGTFGYFCQVHGSPQAGMRGEVVVQGGDEPPPPDDGPGTIRVAAPTYTAAENAGNAQVIVERVGGSDGKATVLYSTTPGTAKPADFKALRNKLLTWNPGQLGPKTVLIGLKNDKTKESTESFSLKLSKPTGAALGESTATVSITDDDSPACAAAALGLEAGLRATGSSADEIRLDWPAESGAGDWLLVERRLADGAFTEIAAVSTSIGGYVDAGLRQGSTYFYRLRLEREDGASSFSDVVAASTDAASGPCEASGRTLCLYGGRFEASADLRREGEPRRAARHLALAESDAAAAFAFPDDGPALFVGVVTSCQLNQHYGITLAVMAEAEVTVRVRDTATGRVWTRFVPAGGTMAQLDADAFATCP